MTPTEGRDGGGREDVASPALSAPPSSRVRLEVAFLDADQSAPVPGTPAVVDERACLTVLVVAAEADLRSYIGNASRAQDLRVLEAASVAAAVALAACTSRRRCSWWTRRRGTSSLGSPTPRHRHRRRRATRRSAPGTRVRLLARPFTAEGLAAEVDRVLE